MSLFRTFVAPLILVVMVVHPAFADNSIVVESRTFAPGQTVCTVGVFISNEVPLVGMVFQLEARTVSGGAYFVGPVGSVFFQVRPGARVDASPLGSADPLGRWPEASRTRRRFATPTTTNTCSGPVSSTWATPTASVDGISPDAVEYATVSVADPQADEEYALAAGADPATRDSASFFFVFDVNTNIGCFEIDSCCTTPANHIAFVDEFTTAIVPSFTKGTICISGCFCECHGNPAVVSNPAIDILDVIYTLSVAFRGQSDIPDTSPVCPIDATDLDCNGHSDVIDVIKMVDVAFRSASPTTVFCDPCP